MIGIRHVGIFHAFHVSGLVTWQTRRVRKRLNHGPAHLYRNDQLAGNRSIRLHLVGTKSNRDAIGARVRLSSGGVTQSRMVKSGSSYLSQSEFLLTFGMGKRDKAEHLVIDWPSGRTEEFKDVAAGRAHQCVEGKGIMLS